MVEQKSSSNLKWVFGLLGLVAVIFIFSVLNNKEEPLPPEVEYARNSINNHYNRVYDYIKNHPYADAQTMYFKFLSLQNETYEYKEKLKSVDRLERYNYDFEKEVVAQTEYFLNQASITNSPKTRVCSICNNSFYGRGYQEVSQGIWRECQEPYQCSICSPACGIKHSQNWNNIYRDAGISTSRNNSTFLDASSTSQYNEGSDGRLYENKVCSLCNGTGFEKGGSSLVQGDEYRICPICKGKGVRSY